jgi:hypothetical protein
MSITFNTENSPAEFDLNVSNRNGYMILRDLLDVEAPECWGSIQPARVLARLATVEARLGALVSPAVEEQSERVVLTSEGVSVEHGAYFYSGGVSPEQLERYVASLTALAMWAEGAGEEIHWG